jgi:hypothetical protein
MKKRSNFGAIQLKENLFGSAAPEGIRASSPFLDSRTRAIPSTILPPMQRKCAYVSPIDHLTFSAPRRSIGGLKKMVNSALV